MQNILVTGALGQIGAELVPALQRLYGQDRVVESDLPLRSSLAPDRRYLQLDCTQPSQIEEACGRHAFGAVYHLAAVLSAKAECAPQAAWTINLGGVYNMLEACRRFGFRLFVPSSIAAFGPSSPRERTPQVTTQRPTTIYGVTKVAGELLCDYYVGRYGVDVRGLRLPGLISWAAAPGGGTTDYAVDMLAAAADHRPYACYLPESLTLDMMYMPDAIAAIVTLMQAAPARLRYRNAYNVGAMNFSPGQMAAEIRKHAPDFAVAYRVDPVREAIAASWPRSLDIAAAIEDWGFSARFDLAATTADMLSRLSRPRLPGKGTENAEFETGRDARPASRGP